MATEIGVERTYSIKEFMQLPDDGFGYELVGGSLQRMSPTGGEHGRITMLLGRYLDVYASANGLGETFAAETAFVLNVTTRDVRAADVIFIRSSRLDDIGEGAIPFPPDLAAEVISPSDRPAAIRRKVTAYLDAGIRLVWVVYPRRQTIEAHRSGDARHTTLGIDDTLDGEDVVPGFSLAISSLFQRR
jgi:Uma2 family endonuclease